MPTMKASRLTAVLEKARNAGQVEEAVTIAGLDLVLASLTAQTLATIHDELKDVPESSYAFEYQLEHVCRSVIEVDGMSLRDVGFIEVDPEAPGGTPVKVERHQWLRDSLVSTWSFHMVEVAFRKVLEVIEAASELANAGVQFKIESESDEEKYRRILGDLKEAGSELPHELRAAILREEGLASAASRDELLDLNARSGTWEADAVEATAPEPAWTSEPPPEPVAATPPAPAVRAPQQLVDAAEPPPGRVPLNQTPIRDPVPTQLPDQRVVTANRRSAAPPPDQVHDLTTKAARFAAIEALQDDPAVLQPEPRVDQKGVQAIVDKPPVAGVNPKYVNPHRGLNPRAAARR